MQDLTGVPAVVDLAAMRDAMKNLGGNPEKINPLAEVDLVIDHSVMIDNFGHKDSFKKNVAIEYERNTERYQLPALGPAGLREFPRRAAGHRHLPPGQSGISGRDGVDPQRQGRQDKDRRSRFPRHAWWAPTATPP